MRYISKKKNHSKLHELKVEVRHERKGHLVLNIMISK